MLAIDGVFLEVMAPPAAEFNNRNQYISGFRRNTQRAALRQLSDIMRRTPETSPTMLKLPEDARILARMHLTELQAKVDAALAKSDLKLDDYTRWHLFDCKLRIKQILEAESEDFGKPSGSGGLVSLPFGESAAKELFERIEAAPTNGA